MKITTLLLIVIILLSSCIRLPSNTQKIHASQYIDTTNCKLQLEFVKTDSILRVYKCMATNDSIVVLMSAKRVEGVNIYNSLKKSEYGFEYYKNCRLYRNYSKYSDTIVRDIYYYNNRLTSIKAEYTFCNGVLNGTSFVYYELNRCKDGEKIKSKANYIDGLLDGETIFYRKNGRIKEIAYYSKGQYLKSHFYNTKGKFTGCVGCISNGSL